MRVLRWAGRFWTGILVITVLLAALLLGLRLLLPFFAATPALLAATPADGDTGVTPRARLTLRFDGPMNPRSVERAVMLRPATDLAADLERRPHDADDLADHVAAAGYQLQPNARYAGAQPALPRTGATHSSYTFAPHRPQR